MNYRKIASLIERLISIVIYAVLHWNFSVDVYYDDPIKRLFGMMVSVIFCDIIDTVVFKIAYKSTGMIHTRWEDSLTKSATHWKIRAALYIIVIVLGKLGIWNFILVPIIDMLYEKITAYGNKKMTEFTDAMMKTLHLK